MEPIMIFCGKTELERKRQSCLVKLTEDATLLQRGERLLHLHLSKSIYSQKSHPDLQLETMRI